MKVKFKYSESRGGIMSGTQETANMDYTSKKLGLDTQE